MKKALENLKKQIGSMIDEDAGNIKKAFMQADGDKLNISLGAAIIAEAPGKHTVKSSMSFTMEQVRNSREDIVDENQSDLPGTEVDRKKKTSKEKQPVKGK